MGGHSPGQYLGSAARLTSLRTNLQNAHEERDMVEYCGRGRLIQCEERLSHASDVRSWKRAQLELHQARQDALAEVEEARQAVRDAMRKLQFEQDASESICGWILYQHHRREK